MQYSSDFTKVMREAGYIYPFDWRRRRMDRDYEEPQGIRISVDDWIDKRERYIAQRVFDWEHFYDIVRRSFSLRNRLTCFVRNLIKNVQRRTINMRTMMKQLIPENTSRKIDSLGRITIPKGLRDRMFLEEGSDLELFTAIIDGRQCICMASPIDDDQKLREAVAAFVECGVEVPENLQKYIEDEE